jgi:hypothetical protein
MTKEQFLNGTPFNSRYMGSSTRPYVFQPWPNWKNGDPVGSLLYAGMNEANVTRVSYYYFDCYTVVVHKVLRVRIYFKDLHV